MATIRELNRDYYSDDDDEEVWVTHYSSNHQILLVGEGDFSFSWSLATSFGSASNICASSLDSYNDVVRKYKKARSNIETLKRLGASVLHRVDATKLRFHPDLNFRRFDRVIFNFPHAGFHGKEDDPSVIRKHKDLVFGFFNSASHLLRANGEIHVSHKNNAPFCDWNLEELASRCFLALIQRVAFEKRDYGGYQNKRGDGSRCDKPFPLGDCSTYKFIFSRIAKELYEAKALISDKQPVPLLSFETQSQDVSQIPVSCDLIQVQDSLVQSRQGSLSPVEILDKVRSTERSSFQIQELPVQELPVQELCFEGSDGEVTWTSSPRATSISVTCPQRNSEDSFDGITVGTSF